MKKRFWLFLSLSLVIALLLVACGGGAAEEATVAPAEPTEEQVAEEPTEEPAEEAMEEPTEEPMEEPTEEPMEEPTEEPMEEPTEEPMEEPTEEAMEEPAEEMEIVTEFGDCEVDLSGETITIHQHAGREGPLASILGDAFAVATEDAITEINDSGGVCGAMLEVVFRETQYDPELEIVAYEEARAADPKPFAVLTYGSGATIALHERVIEDEIVNHAAGLNAEAIYIPRNGYTISTPPIYSDQFGGFLQWLSENWADVKPESAGDEIVVGVIGWAGPFGAGATTPEALDFAESLGVTVLPLEEQPISPDADVTGQVQNLLLQGANVIYNQNLSFGVNQVIGTVRALDVWDDVIVGGVNWTNNQDVINIFGENANLMDGYYAMFPHLGWNDTDHPGIQHVREAFERGGYPESERTHTYMNTYAAFFNYAQYIKWTVEEYGGLEGLTGANYLATIQEHCTFDALGYNRPNVCGDNRSGRESQIRRATWMDDHIEYVVAQDWFELPDLRPPAPEE